MSRRIGAWPYAVGAIFLTIIVMLFYYRDNRNYVCEGCNSGLVENQARMGLWTVWSFPISRVSLEEDASNLYRDYLLVTGHTHKWVFSQGSPYGVFGWGGCATGACRKNNGNLAYYYEREPKFRTFIHKKQADGQLASSEFVAAYLLREPNTYSEMGYLPLVDPTFLEKEPPEVQRLRRLATALEQEFSPR